MEISEVRIKLMDDPHDRLQAFCSITIDACFVIRDLKIIQGLKGSFVAMPSRKLTDRCPKCHTKNHLRAVFCNQCGVHLEEERAVKDPDGRARLYADIAHPINSRCRDLIQAKVLESDEQEVIDAQDPNYLCKYDDYGEDRYADLHEEEESAAEPVSEERILHRIEPGNDGHPAPPHHLSADSQKATAAERQNSAEDGFGAGIV